jgi:PPOX class probable FMN-dependent enzyme
MADSVPAIVCALAQEFHAITIASPSAAAMQINPAHLIDSPDKLASLSGPLTDASIKKEIDYIHPLYAEYIEASPFFTMATVGAHGLDISPRGDPAGFVCIEDARTLLLPERRGNNRIDTLRNLISNPQVALLFLIPGVGETLRVTGHARISVDPALLARFPMHGKLPKCVIVVNVHKVFFQCARAMQHSQLWAPRFADRLRPVPTPGAVLAALTAGEFDGATYDRELPARQSATLY